MVRQKRTAPTSRVVWRITPAAPMGEYVTIQEAPVHGKVKPHPKTADPAFAPHAPDWGASTLDLKSGANVSETPMDTLPGELIDEFFKPRR